MAGKAVKSNKGSKKKTTTASKAKKAAKKTGSKLRSAAKSVKGAVKKAAKKVTSVVRKKAPAVAAKAKPAAKPARPVRRETDIPLDQLAQTYTPQQTSVKAGFRATGDDHHNDQEYARGVAIEDRWNDEDIYTNKSGDPRIGTHGRAYEPGEAKKGKTKTGSKE